MAHSIREVRWAAACHWAAFAGLIVPFGNLFVPAMILFIKRRSSEFVAGHAREAFNFQLSMTLYGIGAILLAAVHGTFFLLLIVIGIASLVLAVVAGLRTADGIPYKYPWTLRVLR